MTDWQRFVYSTARNNGREHFMREYLGAFIDNMTQGSYSNPEPRDTDTVIVTDLPHRFIDAGIILKEDIRVTDREWRELSTEDWVAIRAIQDLPNVQAWECKDNYNERYLLNSTVPSITSLV